MSGCHNVSHGVSHNVTDAGRDTFRTPSVTSGVTQGVTLLQTRPDQTRVFVTHFWGVYGSDPSPSNGDLGLVAAPIGIGSGR